MLEEIFIFLSSLRYKLSAFCFCSNRILNNITYYITYYDVKSYSLSFKYSHSNVLPNKNIYIFYSVFKSLLENRSYIHRNLIYRMDVYKSNTLHHFNKLVITYVYIYVKKMTWTNPCIIVIYIYNYYNIIFVASLFFTHFPFSSNCPLCPCVLYLFHHSVEASIPS